MINLRILTEKIYRDFDSIFNKYEVKNFSAIVNQHVKSQTALLNFFTNLLMFKDAQDNILPDSYKKYLLESPNIGKTQILLIKFYLNRFSKISPWLNLAVKDIKTPENNLFYSFLFHMFSCWNQREFVHLTGKKNKKLNL